MLGLMQDRPRPLPVMDLSKLREIDKDHGLSSI